MAQRWVSTKEVAAVASVDVDTVIRWCNQNRVRARRLAQTGPWRVAVDEDGMPIDAEPCGKSR